MSLTLTFKFMRGGLGQVEQEIPEPMDQHQEKIKIKKKN